MPEYSDDATVRFPVVPRRPAVPEQRTGTPPPPAGHAGDADPPTGPIRAVSPAGPVASQPVLDATTARWVAIGALALLAACAVVDALFPIVQALGANVGYVPISVTMAFAPLLPLLAAAGAAWTAWSLHSRDDRAPVIAAGLAVGVVVGAVAGADYGGPGLFALLLAVTGAVAARLSTATSGPDRPADAAGPASFGAAQALLTWGGAGCLVAVLPAVVDAATTYSGAAAPAFAAVLWLVSGGALLALRARIRSQQARWAVAGAALVALLAVALAGGVGWALALAGVVATAAGLLFTSTSVRRNLGERPLPLVETITATGGSLLRSATRTAGPGTGRVPAVLRRVPLVFWLGGAAGLVLFLVGAGTYGEHSATADSCTVASVGRWSLVEDTPACDDALSGVRTGQALMVAGAVAALALPGRALLRSQDSTPPTSGTTSA